MSAALAEQPVVATSVWPMVPTGEIAEHCLGKMLDKNKNKGTLRPYLRNLNVRWFEFDLSDVLEMRFEDHEADRYQAKRGDLIICEGGYPGRAAIWDDDDPVFIQKALHRVRFDELETAKWLLYWLHLNDLSGRLSSFFSGTGIQHFTKAALSRFEVPLPPLEEQKRIVAVLDQAFAALDRARALAEANLADAEGLLAATIAGVFSSSEDGSTMPLGKISDFNGGSQPPKSQFISKSREGYIRLLQIRDFTSDDKAVFIPDDGKRRRCVEDDIMIARYGASVGQIHRGKAGCYNVALIRTSPDTEFVNREYFYYYLKSDLFQKPLLARSSRGAQDGFNKGDITDLPVPVPALETQLEMVAKIAAVEKDANRLAGKYRQTESDLADLRQSLLQKAFAGELT